MKLYNLMEGEVIHVMEELLKDEKNICTCHKCKLDIAAIALNNLSPKYVVTEKGELLGRANNMTYQFKADVIKEVTRAVKIVSEEPKHY